MSSFFDLTLDTTAPVLTFGGISGTEAGQLLRVAYTVDEAGVDHATLHLADGRTLSMLVQPAGLEVLLPPDTPTGTATVTAVTADDVLNSRSFTLAVELTGIVAAPPRGPGTSPGLPTAPVPRPRRRAPEHRVLRRRSHARAGTATRLTRAASTRSAARADTHARLSTRSGWKSVAVPGSRSTVRGLRTVNSIVSARQTVAVERRPEGPGTEDDLFLLDLL